MENILTICERIDALATESERRARELLAQLDSDKTVRVTAMVEFNRACADFRAALEQVSGAGNPNERSTRIDSVRSRS
jgi:16S rRNA C1402 (ribose-2'-O) methylase RsmI